MATMEQYDEFLKWLYRWRKKFGITPGTNGDHVLAYLINKVHHEHRFRWKHLLRKIEDEALKFKGNKHIAFLGLLCESHFKRQLNAEIQEGKGAYSPESMEELLKGAQGTGKRYRQMLKGEKTPRFAPINPRYLPVWYNFAGPHSKVEEEKLEEDIEEFRHVGEIEKIVKGKSRQAFSKHCHAHFSRIKTLIREEINLRRKVLDADDFDEVLRLNKEIKAKIKEQEKAWAEFKKKGKKNDFNDALIYLDESDRRRCRKLYKEVNDIIIEHL